MKSLNILKALSLMTLFCVMFSSNARAEFVSINYAAQILSQPFIQKLFTNRMYMGSRFESLNMPDGRTGVTAILEASGTLTGEMKEQMQYCVYYVTVLRDPKGENPKKYRMVLEKSECSVIGELPRRKRQ